MEGTESMKQRELTKRQLADHWRVDLRTITRYVAAGLPHKGSRRTLRFNLETAEGWRAGTVAPHMPRVTSKPAPAPVTASGASVDPYRQARTVNETYKARTAKLEYERLTGKMVEGDKIMEAAEKAFVNARVRLRGLAKSMAPILAANIHPAEVEKMLADAIDGALEGLSRNVFD
jgi:hypothetical protein